MNTTLVLIASLIPAFAADAPNHSAGVPSAPITIELYSDFQCPACKALHESTIDELRHDLVSKGKVRLVYRDIHLPMHKYARLAACYAAGAEKLGVYDSVANKLFEMQKIWEENGKVDEIVASVVPPAQMIKLRAIAADPAIGISIDALTQNALYQTKIAGTPTMIIHHGTAADRIGQVSYPILSKYLDELLTTRK